MPLVYPVEFFGQSAIRSKRKSFLHLHFAFLCLRKYEKVQIFPQSESNFLGELPVKICFQKVLQIYVQDSTGENAGGCLTEESDKTLTQKSVWTICENLRTQHREIFNFRENESFSFQP
jgi:hypothetical protein